MQKLFGRKEENPANAEQEEKIRLAFQARCKHFKALLSANKFALETMASLEEALRGEHFFNISFLRASCTTTVTNVFNMVKHLNALCPNPLYKELFERLKIIQGRITLALEPPKVNSSGKHVLPVSEIDFSLIYEVGGKMASLGEACKNLGYTIPRGFVITASGYRHFLASNNLQEEIERRLLMTNFSELNEIINLSNTLKKLIINAKVPEDLQAEIFRQYDYLKQNGQDFSLAVRSSAIGEDSHGASFAGQYTTKLNVPREKLVESYKEVVASKYDITALTYRFNRGIPDYDVPMCVGCVVMVQANSGGVVYSRNPLEKNYCVVINSVFGLPKSVVDGSANADTFQCARAFPHLIIEKNIARKETKIICNPKGGLEEVPLPEKDKELSSLTDEQVFEITKASIDFEKFYGLPQDIEWVYDENNSLIILQSRALAGVDTIELDIPLSKNATLLLEGGICSSPGVAAGGIYKVVREDQMANFPEGAILLVEQAHSKWATLLNKASGVISEYGGAAGHLASVAREYGIPALFGVKKALQELAENTTVTLDADARRIYLGEVEDVLSRKREKNKIFADSPVHKTLVACAAHIVPLNLLEPDSPSFVPANCETLHDITRFCHEKAVEEMFKFDEDIFSARYGKQLRYHGAKLQYFIINIGDGFAKNEDSKYIDLDNINSAPMLALWEGMIAIPWQGPPTASAKSFFSVVAQSASNPDLEITSSTLRMTRNYFMIDRDYCNLQASFGYHFCTVEAQTGDKPQENFVSFHFKGGAATMERRQLRVRMVADILAENGFIVDVKGDALSARAEELSKEESLELMHILGYIIIHTRQMDASLQGERSREFFGNMLRKGIAQIVKQFGS